MALRHTVNLRLEACRSQLAFGLIPKGTVVGAKAVPDWRACRGSSVPKPLGSEPFRRATDTESHRGQWQVENTSYWVRDVTFDEDRSQVRCGNIPHVMAALRNTAIGLLKWAGHTNIAAACRQLAAQPA